MNARIRAIVVLTVLVAISAGCGSFKRWMYAGGDRDEWQQPDRVVKALEIRPGMRVADLGAGGGYFTFRFADAVGDDGQVFAVDVDEGMLAYIADEAAAQGDDQIQTVLAEFDDPLIPGDGVDLLFTSNTYHHLSEREAYFRNAARYLRPGARVAVVEYAGDKGGWFVRWFGHTTSGDEIRQEMTAAGYRELASHDWLERQSFLVFTLAE
jgi:arsenite methyltransferase